MSVRDQIREFITKELLMDPRGVPIKDDTLLLEQGLIDSTGLFSLATFVEERFGVEILDREMLPENFGSVESLARLVEAKRSARGS